jgi:hypothetical protein
LLLISKAYDQMGKSGQALGYLQKYANSSPEAAAEVRDQLLTYEKVLFAKIRESAHLSVIEAAELAEPGRKTRSGARAVEVVDSGPVFEDVPVGIYSEPPGAKIYVDDREWGVLATTPHNMRMFIGKHTLWIEKDFHGVQSFELFVRPVLEDGKPQTVSVQLERENVPVEIKTRPTTAEIVYIKETGERMTLGTGRFNGNLPAGTAKFVVQAPAEGQKTFEESIVASRVDKGGTLFLEFDLRAGGGPSAVVPQSGKLVVSGYLIGADIAVDGSPVGQTPGPVTVDLPAGAHRVVLTKEGYQSWSQMIRVEPDETTTVTTPESLAKAPGGAGWVGWTLVGTSAALAGAGGFFTWQSIAAHEDADKATERGDADAKSLTEDADDKEFLSYALYGAGGAAALVGVLIIATSSGGDDETSAALEFEWAPVPGGGMVLLGLPLD